MMLPSSHITLALLNSISNKGYQFWTNYFSALEKKQTFLFLPRPFMTKKRKISIILNNLLAMRKSLKKAKKVKKHPFRQHWACSACPSMPRLSAPDIDGHHKRMRNERNKLLLLQPCLLILIII